MNEFELIRHYFASAACARTGDAVVLGIGDDCALLELAANQQLAISTDTLVEGVHFPHLAPANLLAQRALAVSTSDLAAMGAAPIGFTLALTLPKADQAWLQAFAEGLDSMAAACNMRLIGGDTTCGPLSITISVFGQVTKHQALVRNAAQAGDIICVSGFLGDAAGALPWVLDPAKDREQVAPLLKHYWQPKPQLTLGLALRGKAHAAQDISDGLLADAEHIANASNKQLCIDPELVPLSACLRAAYGPQALHLALTGGDDYQLIFTLPESNLTSLQNLYPNIVRIGYVSEGQGVKLLGNKQNLDLTHLGYQHFE